MITIIFNLQNGYTFERATEALTEDSSVVDSLSVYSQNCYDATWILALALNGSIIGKFIGGGNVWDLVRLELCYVEKYICVHSTRAKILTTPLNFLKCALLRCPSVLPTG